MSNVRNTIIIGSGPAGLTAAIYTARASLEPLVIEGEPSSSSDQPGGQLMLTTEVENFPGFPEGIMGPELMMNFRAQAERFGAEFITEKVTKVDFASRPFKVWIRDTEYSANSIIVATGAQSLMLDLPKETELIGHGVSTCATCDGFFFRGQEIVVVGGGDSAVEEATFLTKFASKVHLIVRRDVLRASRIMQDRAISNEKIQIHWNSKVSELHGEQSLSGVTLTDMEDTGYLLTRDGSTYTDIEGIFACGDVQDHTYRQAITAAGSGCMAALDCERWLEHQH
jgi:thioredoxin reductase (NADPH)